MILTIVLVSALVAHASLTPLCNHTEPFIHNQQAAPFNNTELANQIYNSVIVGDYKTAVRKTITLDKEGKSDVISSVVNNLLSESKNNVVEFAYKLWNMFGTSIVKIYFPIEFQLMLNEDPMLIINKRDNLALKLEFKTDNAGDRAAFGDRQDKTSHRVSWKLYPVWERNKVSFKILNTHRNQYLKLEVKSDDAGEHKAFGADEDDSYRHQWYFHPVVHNTKMLFYIYNRAYSMPLKLGRYVDGDGDRQLWGHKGNVIGNPEHFGWQIAPL